MKKKILGLILASLGMFSFAQARFFVGVEGGYTVGNFKGTAGDGKGFYASAFGPGLIADAFKNTNGYSAALTLGSENFFGNYFGVRSAIFGGYTSVSYKSGSESSKTNLVDAGLNIDLMLNFFGNETSSFGVFGGAEAGYHYWLNKPSGLSTVGNNLVDFSGRVGISALMGGHHRIEILAKIPFASMGFKTTLGGSVVPLNVSVGASYKFVF